jgi:hypothetical protein
VLRLIAAELRHRRGRAIALLAGIAVATASFTVLTGASESSRLELRGTVAQHFRMSYDLLVRPRGPLPELERHEGLVQRNFLAGIDGGITMDQWRTIGREPDVDVAAPLAVFGYVNPVARLPIALKPHLLPGTRSAFRVGVRWTTDRGVLTLRDPDSYAYVTRRTLDPDGFVGQVLTSHSPTVWETVPGRRAVGICPGTLDAASAFSPAARSWLWCMSTRNGGMPTWTSVTPLTAPVEFPMPMIIAGVDPDAEARLSRTDRAVVSGRWLDGRDGAQTLHKLGRLSRATIPVLAASDPQLDLRADVTLSRLSAAQAQGVRSAAGSRRALMRTLRSSPGTPVSHASYAAPEAYKILLDELRAGEPLEAFWTTGPIHYTSLGPGSSPRRPARTTAASARSTSTSPPTTARRG